MARLNKERRVLNRLTSGFQKLRRNKTVAPSTVKASVMPDAPFFAVGDIHACYAPLRTLMSELNAAAEGEETLVFIGDYIDRGGNAELVLSWLFELTQIHPDKVICLMGNHERMMLDFIDDPAGPGARWLRNGGLDTLASYGIALHQRQADADVAIEVANALEAALPAGLQDWLRALPLRWSSGNVHCVHAGMSPTRAPDDQSEDVLLWGHPKFLTTPRDDGQFVVHGHTVVPRAGVTGSRISIDTGVYHTGRLSAVRVAPGACRFL